MQAAETESRFISEFVLKSTGIRSDRGAMSKLSSARPQPRVTTTPPSDAVFYGHQSGRHSEFPSAVHEVLTMLRDLTDVSNWAVTRKRNDGSLSVMTPTRRSGSNKPEVHDATSTSEFVLDRRKHLPVFCVDIFDEERHGTFGNLVGYRTGSTSLGQQLIAPRDGALAGLLASMLSSVLAQDRRTQGAKRTEERIAYPERDSVTGCVERSAWIRLIECEATRLSRFDDEALLVAVRIDGLEAIKRAQGIEAAEELRREVAFALHSTTTSASLVAHLADDVFAALLCSSDPSGELRAFRSRIETLDLPVTATVGQRLPGERSLDPAQRRAQLL